ncbi:MAG TPA: FAD-dependent monooxygenase [Sphingomonas sp.]|nr:FAD-dependent monooxygenase [Sphingomonas sp.]
MEDRATTDVLICGAGAAGLTLAIDLARRGVRFRLIDKLAAPFTGSRGKGIQPRTLEVFEDIGILDRVAATGSAYPPLRTYRADGSYEDMQIAAGAPTTAEPYRTPLLVPQNRTEAAMRARLAEFGSAPDYGHELIDVVQRAQNVTAAISGPHGVESVTCRYLVGTDGGRSRVRQLLGVDFPGKTLGIRAMVADIELDGLPRDAWHRFNEGDMVRQLAICPLPHTDLFQFQAAIPSGADPDPDVAGLQAFIDERLATPSLTVRAVAWASAYSMNARLADRYRIGRVFLAGDAAHVHPPTGGQGLNTSVQDAYNLGWKLAAALAGAPDALLDTYEEERRPIAADMLGLSTALLDKAKKGDMRRGRDVLQLDLGYPRSSLSRGGADRATGVRPGDRAPDARLLDATGQEQRLFSLLHGGRWALIDRRADASSPPVRTNLTIIDIGRRYHDTDGSVAEAYGLNAPLILIRPDGYVATTADTIDDIDDYLAVVSGTPDTHRSTIAAPAARTDFAHG